MMATLADTWMCFWQPGSRIQQGWRGGVLLALAAALALPVTAATAATPDESMGRRVAGTYLLDVRHEGFPPAAALITLTRDGGFIATDVSDQGAGGLSTVDSPVHGLWAATDRQTLKATTLYFAFDEKGIPKWQARTRGRFVFDRDFRTGRGELLVENFTMQQDPLNPAERPTSTLRGTFTARRVTAD